MEQLIFDEDAKNAIIQLLKELPLQYIGRTLQFHDEPSLSSSLITGDDRFEITYESNLEGGLKREAKAHFGKSLLVEDKETSVVIYKVEIENITWASIRFRFNKLFTLNLGLSFGRILKFKLSKEDIGKFLSSVLHSHEIPLFVEYNVPEMKILCDVEGEIDPGFESSLLKKLEDGLVELPKTFNLGLLNALLTGSMNLSFMSTGYDLKLVSVFVDALKRLAKFIEGAEADPEMMKEYEELSSSPSKSKQLKQSLAPNLYSAYTRIAPLMCILRTLLSKRDTAPDFALYSDLTKTLLAITKTRNAVVSYLASSCLRTMYKLKTEKKLEVNKQWIVKGLDLINTLSNCIIYLLEQPNSTLQLYGLAKVLREVLPDKKEGLTPDDIKYVIAIMLAQSHVLDMVEALTSINCRPLKSEASQIQLKPLKLCFNALDIELFHAYQLETLRLTVLLLINLEGYFASTSERLRHLSSQCVSLAIVENVEGCKLMKRIFPKELFGKNENIVKWDLDEWKHFLERTKKSFDGPTQQWNTECREELIVKLRSSIQKYLAHKKSLKTVNPNTSLMWNINEFWISYSMLNIKCRVGDFYLLNIITETINESGKTVYDITESIPDPLNFWNKLIKKYISSKNVEPKRLILIALKSTYRRYFGIIRKVNMMPYFTHELEDEKFEVLRQLILSFIYTTNTELAFINYKQLLKENGVDSMLSLLASHETKESIELCQLIFKIINRVLIFTAKSSPFPEPRIIGICKESDNLQVIVSLLLVDNEDLVRTVITFISTYIGTSVDFKFNGAIDFLVSVLGGPVGKEAFGLLRKIENDVELNSDLDFSVLEEIDKKIVNEDEKVRKSVFLRYLPVLFVKMINKEASVDKLYKIFMSEQYKQPELIWTEDMRSDLIKDMKEHIGSFMNKVSEFVNTRDYKTAENFPKYTTLYTKIKTYPQLSNEIRSGDYYLDTYDEASPVEAINQNALVESVEKNFADISKDLEHVDLAKIDVLLNSLKRGMEVATKTVDMTPIITVLVQVASIMGDKLIEGNNKVYLKNIAKFITKFIKSGTVLSSLEEEYCHILSVSILKKWFAHLGETKYESLKFNDVNGVRWYLALLYEFIERSSWNVVEGNDRKVILLELFRFIYHCIIYITLGLKMYREREYIREKSKSTSTSVLLFSTLLSKHRICIKDIEVQEELKCRLY